MHLYFTEKNWNDTPNVVEIFYWSDPFVVCIAKNILLDNNVKKVLFMIENEFSLLPETLKNQKRVILFTMTHLESIENLKSNIVVPRRNGGKHN